MLPPAKARQMWPAGGRIHTYILPLGWAFRLLSFRARARDAAYRLFPNSIQGGKMFPFGRFGHTKHPLPSLLLVHQYIFSYSAYHARIKFLRCGWPRLKHRPRAPRVPHPFVVCRLLQYLPPTFFAVAREKIISHLQGVTGVCDMGKESRYMGRTPHSLFVYLLASVRERMFWFCLSLVGDSASSLCLGVLVLALPTPSSDQAVSSQPATGPSYPRVRQLLLPKYGRQSGNTTTYSSLHHRRQPAADCTYLAQTPVAVTLVRSESELGWQRGGRKKEKKVTCDPILTAYLLLAVAFLPGKNKAPSM
ncbi:hypothetical protein B0T26DRAFT_427725 [Lasiosphaeria miniovina]|uniref:Uncharacterized protein n=1 Tax=Lasiosphaeria miniovina TaxID=1954250 RepID=A0AA40A5X6_9PEZI|nr:uncharacterized protein B0T26DRAFT_427725 [Lasiosphaeria miniovina]KAK0709877.1 hypothetical protein B0T26DRAFT_427725 [Lasiosphaeria miniovina]